MHAVLMQVVLLRVHASGSNLFDRAAEVATFRAVSEAGLGPGLRLLLPNARIEEFLMHHVTLSASDMSEPEVSAAIAATLAAFHVRVVRIPSAARLWRHIHPMRPSNKFA